MSAYRQRILAGLCGRCRTPREERERLMKALVSVLYRSGKRAADPLVMTGILGQSASAPRAFACAGVEVVAGRELAQEWYVRPA